jgi:hypothetical protein
LLPFYIGFLDMKTKATSSFHTEERESISEVLTDKGMAEGWSWSKQTKLILKSTNL